MSDIREHQASLPSRQYGAYESSYDQYPDERRWAKRFALRKLRNLLRVKASDGRVLVHNLQVMERFNDYLECDCEQPKYSYGWKCELVLLSDSK